MKDPKAERLLNKLLDEAIKPHAVKIAEIAARGEIAVVAFEPSEMGLTALETMGRRNGEPVFALNRTRAMRLLGETDPVTKRWASTLATPERAKIFVVAQKGTLLVNFESGRGFSIEPGTTTALTTN